MIQSTMGKASDVCAKYKILAATDTAERHGEGTLFGHVFVQPVFESLGVGVPTDKKSRNSGSRCIA